MSGYTVIVADPPWDVQTGPAGGGMGEGFTGGDGRSRKLAYPTMSIPQIQDLAVDTIAADNAVLYLWTINRYVEESYEVARRWGFKPSTLLTWAKAPMGGGLGGAYGISSEYILYARRGQPVEHARVGRTWFDWKRPYNSEGKPWHSAKPDAFLDMVEGMHPGPYCELYARRARFGWDYYGDQALETIDLPEVAA